MILSEIEDMLPIMELSKFLESGDNNFPIEFTRSRSFLKSVLSCKEIFLQNIAGELSIRWSKNTYSKNKRIKELEDLLKIILETKLDDGSLVSDLVMQARKYLESEEK